MRVCIPCYTGAASAVSVTRASFMASQRDHLLVWSTDSTVLAACADALDMQRVKGFLQGSWAHLQQSEVVYVSE